MWQRTIDCLGIPIRVRTNAAEIEGPLAGVLRSYADTVEAPRVDYFLHAAEPYPRVQNGDEIVRWCETPIDMIPAFERDLYTRLLSLVGDVTLHAGAIVDARGRAFVLAGESGAGKSTLVHALLAEGLRYLSEEYVALRPGARCRGLARALHVSDRDRPVPAGWTCDDYPLRPNPPGTYRLFHPPPSQIWRGEAETAAVIAISHAPDAPDTLRPLTSGEAIQALWPAIFHRTADDLARIAPALAGVPLRALRTTTRERALERVLEIVRG